MADKSSWYIDNDGFFIQNSIKLSKITLARSGMKKRQMYFVLANGNKCTLELDNFDIDKYSYIEEICKTSRSKFMNWLEKTFKDIPLIREPLTKSEITGDETNTVNEQDTINSDQEMDFKDISYGAAKVINDMENDSENGNEKAKLNEPLPPLENQTVHGDLEVVNDTDSSPFDFEHENDDQEKAKLNEPLPPLENQTVHDELEVVNDTDNSPFDFEHENDDQEKAKLNEPLPPLENQTVHDELEVVNDTDSSPFDFEHENDDQEQTDISSELEKINKKCKGKRILIPVKNLVEPDVQRRVREMDIDHVRELETQFSKGQQLFTILIGTTSSSLTIDDLQEEGHPVIEVIGGNHTRQALQNLLSQGSGSISYVLMDVYADLTNTQALMLGIAHNSQHEHSRNTTFMDIVTMLRHLFEQAHQQFPKKERKAAINWRNQASLVLGVDKRRMKNLFQIHLHCASLGTVLWNAFEEFSTAWKEGKIAGQLKTDLKQTHLNLWVKIKGDDQKLEFIKKLTNGDITFSDFRENCTTSKISKEGKKTNCEKKKNSNKNDHPGAVNFRKEKESEQLVDERAIKAEEEVKKLKKLLLNRQNTETELRDLMNKMEKDLKSENDRLKEEIAEVQQRKDKEVVDMKKKLMQENKELNDKIRDLEERLQFAEEAAQRARSRIKENNKVEDLLPETSEQNLSTTIPKKKSKTDMQKDVIVIDETIEEETKEDMYFVEYNNNKVYIAKIGKNNRIVYMKKPYVTNIYVKKTFTNASNYILETTAYGYEKRFVIGKVPGNFFFTNHKGIEVKNKDKLQEVFLAQLDLYLQKKNKK